MLPTTPAMRSAAASASAAFGQRAKSASTPTANNSASGASTKMIWRIAGKVAERGVGNQRRDYRHRQGSSSQNQRLSEPRANPATTPESRGRRRSRASQFVQDHRDHSPRHRLVRPRHHRVRAPVHYSVQIPGDEGQSCDGDRQPPPAATFSTQPSKMRDGHEQREWKHVNAGGDAQRVERHARHANAADRASGKTRPSTRCSKPAPAEYGRASSA